MFRDITYVGINTHCLCSQLFCRERSLPTQCSINEGVDGSWSQLPISDLRRPDSRPVDHRIEDVQASLPDVGSLPQTRLLVQREISRSETLASSLGNQQETEYEILATCCSDPSTVKV